MKYHAALFCLLGFYSLAIPSGDSYKTVSQQGIHDWKKLILSHHWPASVCKMDDIACQSPPDYWTVHGLWTDKAQTCNKSWHFDEKEIEDLLPEMEKWWPDVLHPNHTQLWKHEWEKHGTCAASLSCLDSQHKYFSGALDLYKKTDLNSVLAKYGIVPSATYYRMQDIKHAVEEVYGVTGKVQCFPLDQIEDVQVLAQIEICFTKELQPRNCSNAEDAFQMVKNRPASWDLIKGELRVCNDTVPTYYPPVNEL